MNTQEFKIKGTEVHLGKYTYPRSIYLNARTNLVVTCPVHGDFSQNPSSHLKGMGCRKCAHAAMKGNHSNKKKTMAMFIIESSLLYPGLYGYHPEEEYISNKHPVTIICKIHGDFKTIPNNHLTLGAGCPHCGPEKAHKPFRKTFEDIVASSRAVHKDEYEYVESPDYKNNKEDMTVICKEHGEFRVRVEDHYSKGYGCPRCSQGGRSKQEMEVEEFIRSVLGSEVQVVTSDRSVIAPLEIDILVPELKLAIEYDGLYWHSTANISSTRAHLNKTRACEEAGYRLIHIYEDEWLFSKDLVKQKLASILGKCTLEKIGARETTVVRLSNKEGSEFLNKYHLQGGNAVASYVYGLVTKSGELVSCMTFCNNRDIVNKELGTMELTKFCSSKNVVGAFSKLLNAFIKDNGVTKIVSYSDKRWSIGGVYSKNGFTKESTSNPSYDYCNKSGKRFSKQLFRKEKLKTLLPDTYSDDRTEWEMTAELKLYRIYNCGMDRWVLNLK